MTDIHLIRIPIDVSNLSRWAVERGWSGRSGTTYDEGRALHHLITEMWGRGSILCFRILVPPRRRLGNLYAYSKMNADGLRDMALAHALPEHLEIAVIDKIAGKIIPTSWKQNQRLGFDLRIRPVRRLGSDLKGPDTTISAGSEIDAFLLEALRDFPDTSCGMMEKGRSREEVYLDWIKNRFSPISTLDKSKSRLVRFRRLHVARERNDSEGPDATVHGILTINKPMEFPQLLTGGVGRHKAYGFGMLLLRPPGVRMRKY